MQIDGTAFWMFSNCLLSPKSALKYLLINCLLRKAFHNWLHLAYMPSKSLPYNQITQPVHDVASNSIRTMHQLDCDVPSNIKRAMKVYWIYKSPTKNGFFTCPTAVNVAEEARDELWKSIFSGLLIMRAPSSTKLHVNPTIFFLKKKFAVDG